MRYDIQTLRVFVAIAEEGLISSGEAREATVASAVCKRISEMEQACGVTSSTAIPEAFLSRPRAWSCWTTHAGLWVQPDWLQNLRGFEPFHVAAYVSTCKKSSLRPR